MRPEAVLLLATSVVASALPTLDPAATVARPGPIERGEDAAARRLIGRPAPPLPALRWLDGDTRDLASLRGKVVVVRSFTNACPFCASTLPSLQRLHAAYSGTDVVVLGVYHPKPPAATRTEDVAELARSLGADYPVAVDEDWKLVKSWWRAFGDAPWTSITWVLDRKGTVRFVHPGGEWHDEGGGPAHARCRADFVEIRRTIDALLAEPAPR